MIFNNQKPILATEWIEDLTGDASEKRDALKLNLPDAQIVDIYSTRERFHSAKIPYRLVGHGGVRGGVAAGAATYVSWVDELVWHSTPAPLSRTEYYKNILKPENYWKYKPYAVAAMQVFYRFNKEHNENEIPTFARFCRRKGVTESNQITTRLCDDYMSLVQTESGYDGQYFFDHMKEISALARYSVNNLKSGKDLEADPFAKTTESRGKKTGIRSTIRRRNSLGNRRPPITAPS
jgi:hypothetical protein